MVQISFIQCLICLHRSLQFLSILAASAFLQEPLLLAEVSMQVYVSNIPQHMYHSIKGLCMQMGLMINGHTFMYDMSMTQTSLADSTFMQTSLYTRDPDMGVLLKTHIPFLTPQEEVSRQAL